MIDLSNITLFSISDNKYLDKTIKAMKHCLSKAHFYEAKLLTNNNIEKIEKIDTIVLNKNFDQIEYAKICINNLNHYIDSEYVLLIQWDGFIINENLWDKQFLKYDYIGSPWGFPKDCKNRVGNGGFSLRSKKFLEISTLIDYTPHEYEAYTQLQKIDRPIAPEDWFLCYHSYKKFLDNNIKFAPIDLAYSFSVEHPSDMKMYDREKLETYKSFGFHGHFNTAAMKILE